jgi:hypothetical protein
MLWKYQQTTSFVGNSVGSRGKFSNATGTSKLASYNLGCPCQKTPTEYDTTQSGIKLWHCPGGQWCDSVATGVSTDGVKPRAASRMGSF